MLWKGSIMSIRKEHLFLLLLPFSQTVLTYTLCFSDITAQISFSPSIRHLRKGCGEVSATSSSLPAALRSWKFTWFLPCSGIAIPIPELLTAHTWLPLPPSAAASDVPAELLSPPVQFPIISMVDLTVKQCEQWCHRPLPNFTIGLTISFLSSCTFSPYA